MLGEADAFGRGDFEELKHSICARSVELRHRVFVLLRRHGAEDEIAVVFHFPFLQHCESTSMSSHQVKLRQHEKQVKDQ
jgi:hypothetical protein